MADTSGNLLYLYKARTVEGKVIKGKVHAPNEPTAVAAVEAKGLIPLSVRDNASVSVLSRDLGGNNRALKKPKLKDLAVAMKQLGVMIGSGVTLLRALARFWHHP